MHGECCWRASCTCLCSMGSCFWIAQRCKHALVIAALFALAGCTAKSDLPALGAVPDFQLSDQHGSAFDSARTLKGRVWVADFFFTNCPGPCPRMSSQMHQVQKALEGTDARMVSMTIDPDRDTPPVLAEYASHFEAKPGVWYFLTGSPDTLGHLDHDV